MFGRPIKIQRRQGCNNFMGSLVMSPIKILPLTDGAYFKGDIKLVFSQEREGVKLKQAATIIHIYFICIN